MSDEQEQPPVVRASELRISERIHRQVQHSLVHRMNNDDVTYDVVTTIMADQQGQPRGAMSWLVMAIPNPLLGEGPLSVLGPFSSMMPTDDEVEQAVGQLLEALRSHRTQLLAGSNGHGGAPGPLTGLEGLRGLQEGQQ